MTETATWVASEADDGVVNRPSAAACHSTSMTSCATVASGGRRWWFACYNDLVWKHHLPAGSSRFASRHEHGLGHRSQRQSPRDRAVSRAWKARSRVDAIGDIGGPCFKPK